MFNLGDCAGLLNPTTQEENRHSMPPLSPSGRLPFEVPSQLLTEQGLGRWGLAGPTRSYSYLGKIKHRVKIVYLNSPQKLKIINSTSCKQSKRVHCKYPNNQGKKTWAWYNHGENLKEIDNQIPRLHPSKIVRGKFFLIIFKCSIREPKITNVPLKLHLPDNDSKHPSEHRALLILHSTLQPGPWQWLQNHSLGCTPHLAQTLTHIRAAVVFLSTSCNSHFSPYPKFKTFFSFTIKFKLSQFEAQRKHRAEKHTAQN